MKSSKYSPSLGSGTEFKSALNGGDYLEFKTARDDTSMYMDNVPFVK